MTCLFGIAVASEQPEVDEPSGSSLIERGLAAAQKGDWSLAYSLFITQRSGDSPYPICYLIAVSAARLHQPDTAFRYAKLSANALESLPAKHVEQRNAIAYWARPSVIGTDAECPLPSRQDLLTLCEIDQPGKLEALVEEYFGGSLLDLMLTSEWINAEEEQSCENAGFDYGDPALPRDSKVRCKARRAFSFYDYEQHPPGNWDLAGLSGQADD
jgi:hypothetical protein